MGFRSLSLAPVRWQLSALPQFHIPHRYWLALQALRLFISRHFSTAPLAQVMNPAPVKRLGVSRSAASSGISRSMPNGLAILQIQTSSTEFT